MFVVFNFSVYLSKDLRFFVRELKERRPTHESGRDGGEEVFGCAYGDAVDRVLHLTDQVLQLKHRNAHPVQFFTWIVLHDILISLDCLVGNPGGEMQ